MENRKHFSVRVDEATLKKFQYIAKYDDRTASRQIVYLIHKCIRDFEKEHGEIVFDPTTDQKKTNQEKTDQKKEEEK